MLLVAGATGFLGAEICRRLVANQQPVRALVRATSSPEKTNALKALGAELVVGDLCDPASLKAACQGISTVISTVSSMPFSYQPCKNDIQTVDLDGEVNLIAAAKAAGVQHFIYTSFSGNLDLDFPLRNAKRTVEQHLKASGMTYTILRPGYFMEVWLTPAVGFDAANAKAQVYGTGDQSISWIPLQDVAAFAVSCVKNPIARNCTLELGGPQALSPHQVIQVFEEAQRRKFEVTHVPLEALQAQLQGATDPMQQSFIGLMLCYAQGDPIDMRSALEVFPMSLVSVQDYVRRASQN
ncbi:MAG: SDR family oxidoreductase [Acidobacteriota bacterium]